MDCFSIRSDIRERVEAVIKKPEYRTSGNVATNQGNVVYEGTIDQNYTGCFVINLRHGIHGKKQYTTYLPLNGLGTNKRDRKIARTLRSIYKHTENAMEGLEGHQQKPLSSKARKRAQAAQKRGQPYYSRLY